MTYEPRVWRCDREICEAGRLILSFDSKRAPRSKQSGLILQLPSRSELGIRFTLPHNSTVLNYFSCQAKAADNSDNEHICDTLVAEIPTAGRLLCWLRVDPIQVTAQGFRRMLAHQCQGSVMKAAIRTLNFCRRQSRSLPTGIANLCGQLLSSARRPRRAPLVQGKSTSTLCYFSRAENTHQSRLPSCTSASLTLYGVKVRRSWHNLGQLMWCSADSI